MKHQVILDTGPLVASLNSRDKHHAWTLKTLADCGATLFTCEAVLSEAYFLLQQVPGAHQSLLALLSREVIDSEFSYAQEIGRVNALLHKFADVPMSFADACLVRLSECRPEARVLTLDRNFLVYRRNDRDEIPLLAPFQQREPRKRLR